ncbi:MAG: hypothetical protein JXR96_26865 [Deltaproteobacteria bacterium]|nr:hypothetical protein [Deltaproteobacteria bacterium]
MTARRSNTFQAFLAQWEAPLKTREAVEEQPWRLIHIARSLSGAERRKLISFLAKRIRQEDILAAIVSGGARYRGTLAALDWAVEHTTGWMRTEAARSVEALTGGRRRKGKKSPRLALIASAREGCRQAVVSLGCYRGKQVIEALISALDSEDDLLRSQAASSLVTAAGLAEERDEGFGRLRAYLSAGFASIRRYGIACFRRCRASEKRRRSCRELERDLALCERTQTFDRFFALLFPDEGSGARSERKLDMRLARRLSADEKVWAEYALLLRVLEGDMLPLPALGVVGGGLSLSVLAEALDRFHGEDRRRARRILEKLGRK